MVIGLIIGDLAGSTERRLRDKLLIMTAPYSSLYLVINSYAEWACSQASVAARGDLMSPLSDARGNLL